MKKMIVIASMMVLLLGFSTQGMARIHIGVNIPLPPVVVFSGPPELVVIPDTDVYYCPDLSADIFFYGGFWYRPYGGYWYRAVGYEGPWIYIQAPPAVLVSLPPDYRTIVRGERRIPYGELHRNWRVWQRDRYWAHHNWGRMEHERRQGLAPSYRERERGRYQGAAPQFRERGPVERGGGIHERGGYRGGTGGVHERGGNEGHERR